MAQSRKLVFSGGALATIALIVAVVVLLAGRGGASPEEPSATTTPSTTAPEVTTTTAAPGPPVAPLTGQPVEDPAVLDRPAVVVKIDNADRLARPQAGVNAADVVYEEKVEGAVTRFAAIYHSGGTDLVGPVRSARSTDLLIMRPLNMPIFAYSGANAVFAQLVDQAPLVALSYDDNVGLYYRRDDRPSPDNVFTSTQTFRDAAAGLGQAPSPLFTYRAAGDPLPPSAVDVAGVSYRFGGSNSGGAPVSFFWDAGRKSWARRQAGTEHTLEGEGQITAENVIIQFVRYLDTGLVDAAGTPVPEAELVAAGDAWVLTDGHAITARWSRSTEEDVTTYVDEAGDPIDITPGRTWVALVPSGGGTLETCEAHAGTPSCG